MSENDADKPQPTLKSNPSDTNFERVVNDTSASQEKSKGLKLSSIFGVPPGVKNLIKNQKELLDSLSPQNSLLKDIHSKIEEQREILRIFNKSESPLALAIERNNIQKEHIKNITAKPTDYEFPELPQEPILETNRRLKQVEEHLEKLITVGASAAKTATDIQSYAADFLVKFEKASAETDASASRGIRLAKIAVIIALATPFLQMIFDAGKDWLYPDTMGISIQTLHEEIKALRANENSNTDRIVFELKSGAPETAEKISNALRQGNQETTQLLRDIAKLLKQQTKQTPPPTTQE